MANVCLLLEGTYPYVSGGVSACVHQLISKLPRTTFTLLYIGTSSDEYLSLKYKLPPNVVGLQELFLFDELNDDKRRTELSKEELWALDLFHQTLHGAHPPSIKCAELQDWMNVLFPYGQGSDRLFQALASRGIWKLLLRETQRINKRIPFIDFFYTWRSAHIPIYKALSGRYPKAQLYHALSTGYAGLAGMCASVQNNAPLVITEHGIYAHERAIEITEAEWFSDSHSYFQSSSSSMVLKDWWIQMFKNMSTIAYEKASTIITLHNGNRARQIEDGADPSKIELIPNGINLKFHQLRRRHLPWPGPMSGSIFRIGFVGRVVPIKDVKTLIKAICIVRASYPHVTCQIVGPCEEDPAYFQQCSELVAALGLETIMKFSGKMDVMSVYPTLDCLVLTSISESQPLVVLEANCAGIPVVATEVGSCRELLEGRKGIDRGLGPSGILAPIGDPDTIAQQILKLIHSPQLWEQLSVTGVERVSTFYDENELVSRYETIYRRHISAQRPVSIPRDHNTQPHMLVNKGLR
ncbi:MAG: GT4 family glycosyltransferase PelF [Deltaproteobacteria bacterium]|nr:GT4 family glycosyltransferase PelF [Deltaproteobacteria bacterium]